MLRSNFLIETLEDYYSLIILAPFQEQADEYCKIILNIFSKIEILKKNSFLISNKFEIEMLKELNIFNFCFKEILHHQGIQIFEIKEKMILNSFETCKLILKGFPFFNLRIQWTK
jgi:hypothetical protein